MTDAGFIIRQFSLSAFDITTASYDGQYDFSNFGEVEEIVFNDDDTKMYILFDGDNVIYQFATFDTSADITTLGLSSAPSVICRDELPVLSTCFETSGGRCVSRDRELTLVSSTTSQYVGTLDGNLVTLEAGDLVIPYEAGVEQPPIAATGVSVSGNTYTVSFNTLAYSPSLLVVPDRSVVNSNTTNEEWVTGDYIERNYGVITDEDKRGLQYKLVGETNSEVSRIVYFLNKVG